MILGPDSTPTGGQGWPTPDRSSRPRCSTSPPAWRVSAPRSAQAITNDVDQADRLDVLEGCYRVLGDAMDSMWTAWAQFDQGEMH